MIRFPLSCVVCSHSAESLLRSGRIRRLASALRCINERSNGLCRRSEETPFPEDLKSRVIRVGSLFTHPLHCFQRFLRVQPCVSTFELFRKRSAFRLSPGVGARGSVGQRSLAFVLGAWLSASMSSSLGYRSRCRICVRSMSVLAFVRSVHPFIYERSLILASEICGLVRGSSCCFPFTGSSSATRVALPFAVTGRPFL